MHEHSESFGEPSERVVRVSEIVVYESVRILSYVYWVFVSYKHPRMVVYGKTVLYKVGSNVVVLVVVYGSRISSRVTVVELRKRIVLRSHFVHMLEHLRTYASEILEIRSVLVNGERFYELVRLERRFVVLGFDELVEKLLEFLRRYDVAFRNVAERAVVYVREHFVYVESPCERYVRNVVLVFYFVRYSIDQFYSLTLLRCRYVYRLEAVVSHYQSFYHRVVDVVSEVRDVGNVVNGVLYEFPVFESLLVQSRSGERERIVYEERLVAVYR